VCLYIHVVFEFSRIRVARSIVFCVVFCRSLLVFFLLAIVFVCPYSIDGFWLHLWYLQTLQVTGRELRRFRQKYITDDSVNLLCFLVETYVDHTQILVIPYLRSRTVCFYWSICCMHQNRTKSYSLPLSKLDSLYSCLHTAW
jgi:hypothetical protein